MQWHKHLVAVSYFLSPHVVPLAPQFLFGSADCSFQPHGSQLHAVKQTVDACPVCSYASTYLLDHNSVALVQVTFSCP